MSYQADNKKIYIEQGSGYEKNGYDYEKLYEVSYKKIIGISYSKDDKRNKRALATILSSE